MKVEQVRSLVDEAVRAGYIFEQDRTILSTTEGYNRAALAVLGAMVLNLGEPTFNMYCENQFRLLGWLQSRSNPLAVQARDLRAKYRRNDPSARSMFEDVEREFMAPLLEEHARKGGRGLSPDQAEATCSMLLAKILWDLKLGNADLACLFRMLEPGSTPGAAAAIDCKREEDDIIEASSGRKIISTREFGRTLIDFIGHDEPELFKEIIHRICREHHEWEGRVAYEWIMLKAFTVTYALQRWFEEHDATLCEEILDVFHENLGDVVVAMLPKLRRRDFVEDMRVRYEAYYHAMQHTGGRSFLDPVKLGQAFVRFIPGAEGDIPTIAMADIEAWSSLIGFMKFLKNDLVKYELVRG